MGEGKTKTSLFIVRSGKKERAKRCTIQWQKKAKEWTGVKERRSAGRKNAVPQSRGGIDCRQHICNSNQSVPRAAVALVVQGDTGVKRPVEAGPTG